MTRIRWAAALLLAVLPAAAGCGATSAPVAAEPPAPQPSRAAVAPARAPKITYPARGRAQWWTAPASARTGGSRGRLLRYRVRVERDIRGLALTGFADAVSAALDDPRGWTAGGALRLRRSGLGQPYDFTIYLATPRTRDALCGSAGDAYTSCRNGDKVVLNVARWVKGVSGYGAPLSVYRQYMVNHEVGHRLGHGHERCPGKGLPAPVMQQQTLGLHGCTAYPWPYRSGRRYAGASGAYPDPLPAPERARR
ncbi:DUF3152 domain-containing protein [Actinoplanes sp. NPDC049548]|uniref:DUF3152 domain-containing protein n=1 Tax=Actinoplanes sp. NPDC049548 TaxID=3155152 RepID=UPI003416B17B